uniref:Uncharacterized protein n=1 Tax=Anguilla anguilla TaxID=7936 RepID=A0A0E9PEP5_ANGAN
MISSNAEVYLNESFKVILKQGENNKPLNESSGIRWTSAAPAMQSGLTFWSKLPSAKMKK